MGPDRSLRVSTATNRMGYLDKCPISIQIPFPSALTVMTLKTQAEAAGWLRFEEVTVHVPDGRKLYRSSAPSYEKQPRGNSDFTQKLTERAVAFLVHAGIDSIISLNEFQYKAAEIEKLKALEPPIAYLHLPLSDFSAPTLQQLENACTFFPEHKSTLVHCGFGHGRTGTGITALQIGSENGQTMRPYANIWPRPNRVEKRAQMSVLTQLRSIRLQNRMTGIPAPKQRTAYLIINFGTGYYLMISKDNKTIIAKSPEKVEGGNIGPKFKWFINKDTASNFTLLNCVTARSQSFASTKLASAAQANDPVTNGPVGPDVNTLFSVAETEAGSGRYAIFIPNTTHAMAINEPNNEGKKLRDSGDFELPALLAPKDDSNLRALWILVPQER